MSGDKKGSSLTAISTLAAADLIIGVDTSAADTRSITPAVLLAYAGNANMETHEVRGAVSTAGILTLSTAETTVVDGDKLGQIDFQAPLEASGTDAILVAASIWAEADATFGAADNSTDIVFATGESETATEKMRLLSSGDLAIQGAGSRTLSAYCTDTGVVNTPKTFLKLYGTNTSADKKEQLRIAAAPGMNASSGGQCIISTNNAASSMSERLRIDEKGNVSIGISTTPTGGGAPCLVMGQTTDPTGIPGNSAGIFSKDVAGTAKIHHVDEDGTVTLHGPHDAATGEWVHMDHNYYTGVKRLFRMERIIRFLGERFPAIAALIEDGQMPAEDLQDWDANQDRQLAHREREIRAANENNARREKLLAQGAAGESIPNEVPVPETYQKKDTPPFIAEAKAKAAGLI